MAEASASYIAKWQQRQPEMRVLEAFAAPDQRTLLTHWWALWNELDEAMFELSDPAVARSKLAWWGQDLAAGARAQHPLVRALLAEPRAAAVSAARWRELAQQAIALASDEFAADDIAGVKARWQPLADVFAVLEQALFGRADAARIAAQWQMARALRALRRGQPERAGLPLQLLARHGLVLGDLSGQEPPSAFWRDYRDELYGTAAEAAALPRRARDEFDRLQLNRLVAGQPLARAMAISPWRALWLAWRAARRGARD